MSGHNISPIAEHPVSNFLDDSILFSQKSQWDPNDGPNLTSPITPIPNKKDYSKNFPTSNYTPQGFQFDDPQSKENILNMIKFTNHTLNSFGFSQLGDLTSNKDEEIQKTLNAVHELVQQRIKDIEFRKEVFERIAKLQHDKGMYMQTVERLKQDNQGLSKEIGALKNQFMKLDKKNKEERDKLLVEKDGLSKSLVKHTQKVTQYQHDLRKKEVDVNKAKEQMLKKALNSNARHSAEMLTNNGSNSFKSKQNAENDLITMVSYNVDIYRNKLLLENQELRNMLFEFQSELINLITEKKDEFIQKRISEIDKNMQTGNAKSYFELYFSDIKFATIKEGMLQMPIEKGGDEIIQAFRENIRVFGEFLNKLLKFNYSPEFFKNVSPEIAGIDQEFLKINNMVEFKKAIGDLKQKPVDDPIFSKKQKKEHFPSMDYSLHFEHSEREASYGSSPIQKNKEFDASLCKELLDEFPQVERREFPPTQDIENKLNTLLTTLKDSERKIKEHSRSDSDKKTVLQETNKWRSGWQNRASLGGN